MSKDDASKQNENSTSDAAEEVASPAEAPVAAPNEDSPAAPRRARRRRQTTRSTTPAVAEPPASKPSGSKQSANKARSPRARKPSKNLSSAAPIRQHRRRVFKQDPIEGVSPATAPIAEEKSQETQKTSHSNAIEADRLTLILHPAPKATQANTKKKKAKGPQSAKLAMQARAAKRSRKKGSPSKAQKRTSDGPALDSAWLEAKATNAESIIREAGSAHCTRLIDAWLKDGHVAAIAVVANLNDGPSGSRKHARRALNVLKARGVEIPDVVGSTAATKAEEEHPVTAKYVPPDTNGMAFFSITQRQPGGRYRVADIITQSPLGIIHASSGQIPGRQIRQWHQRVKERFGAEPVQVPVEWARHCVAEARKENEASKEILPLGLEGCTSLFSPEPTQLPEHPVSDLDDKVDDKAVIAARDNSAALHESPEFRSWFPETDAMNDLLQRLGQRVGSSEAADNEENSVSDAVIEEVTAATDRFFTPEHRSLLADRMRGSAISVRSRLGDDAAIRVLAVAKAVRDAGLVTDAPSELPFLLTFFKKGIAQLVKQGKLTVPVPD